MAGRTAFSQQDTLMKTQHQTAVMLIGICLCAICALFPPRRLVGGGINYPNSVSNAEVTRVLLFGTDLNVFERSRNGVREGWPVELDDGRLLSELVLIASLTGIVILVPRFKK
jgi:hypothetical protein